MRILISFLMCACGVLAALFLLLMVFCFFIGEIASGFGFFALCGMFFFLGWAASIYRPKDEDDE